MVAGGYLGGDKSFYKPILDSRAFFQTPVLLGQDWMSAFVLGVHGRAGWAIPYSAGTGAANGADDSATAVPTSELFFMGGTDTVRGYNERTLGASQLGGGRFSLLGNIEYGFKPAPPVKLRVFYDTGNAYADATWLGQQNPYLYSSWGFGMLFTIPTSVIQIRLDVGFPLQPPDGYAASDHYKIHFNIGNIF
jgi:outer membrane protein assembly factor BamA